MSVEQTLDYQFVSSIAKNIAWSQIGAESQNEHPAPGEIRLNDGPWIDGPWNDDL
jgi:hypothetical protein